MCTKNRFMIISRITLVFFILTGVIGVHSVQALPKISNDTISGVDYLNPEMVTFEIFGNAWTE